MIITKNRLKNTDDAEQLKQELQMNFSLNDIIDTAVYYLSKDLVDEPIRITLPQLLNHFKIVGYNTNEIVSAINDNCTMETRGRRLGDRVDSSGLIRKERGLRAPLDK